MSGPAEHNIVVIGASAGGVEALKKLFKGLPNDFPAAIFVVLHLNPFAESHLPEVLNSAGRLRAHHPKTEETVKPGAVYVAPPNRHLVIEDSTALLTTAPKENRARPAINPLFRSAAAAYGPRVVGVILSGLLDDGTAGLWEIKKRGGIAIAQSDAFYPQMAQSAVANVQVDYFVPLEEIPKLLSSLCKSGKKDDDSEHETDMPRLRGISGENPGR